MGTHFIAQTEYATQLPCRPARMRTLLDRCLEGDGTIVLVAEAPDGALVGMIGALVSEHPYSGERVASELFWWVEPAHRGHGRDLMKAAEAWARDQGAARFQMVAPNARVGRLYERFGYTAVETLYQRSL